MMPGLAYARILVAASASLALACDRDTLLVSSRVGPDAGPHEDAGALDAGRFDAGGNVPDAGLAVCGNHICECANGKDDDGDDLTDGFDGECIGAFDDDETTFSTGQDRGGNPRCASCAFEEKPGAGKDACRIAASCLETGVPQDALATCNTCEPTTECKNRCLARTPNGCDCFGCCEIRLPGGSVTKVVIGADCKIFEDSMQGCQPCTFNDSCFNPCGRCELCPGKTEADLPADCQSAGGLTCEGSPLCTEKMPCASEQYCGLGCCLDVL